MAAPTPYRVTEYEITGPRGCNTWEFRSRAAALKFVTRLAKAYQKDRAYIHDGSDRTNGHYILSLQGRKWGIKVEENPN